MALLNPLVIQKHTDALSAPLILIHDGGGTVFNYFFLGNLGRHVYGIFNPRFETGEQWHNGIPEIAGHYLQTISACFGGRDVILGGTECINEKEGS